MKNIKFDIVFKDSRGGAVGVLPLKDFLSTIRDADLFLIDEKYNKAKKRKVINAIKFKRYISPLKIICNNIEDIEKGNILNTVTIFDKRLLPLLKAYIATLFLATNNEILLATKEGKEFKNIELRRILREDERPCLKLIDGDYVVLAYEANLTPQDFDIMQVFEIIESQLF